jgi:hypothetical protein
MFTGTVEPVGGNNYKRKEATVSQILNSKANFLVFNVPIKELLNLSLREFRYMKILKNMSRN